jgi:CysZ protein
MFLIVALGRAFRQLSDPRFQRVLWRSLLISALTFVATWVAAWFGVRWGADALIDWVQGPDGGFWTEVLTYAAEATGLVAILVASFLLFPAVVATVMSFLLDEVAEAVEDRHYPGLPPARDQPWGEIAADGARFAGITIVLNVLLLPLYLVLLFVPPLNVFVFYGINGYLLSREYFEQVAVRRLDSGTARKVRKAHRGALLLAGMVIALLLTVPVVNILMPIVATGFMVHLFERYRRRDVADAGSAAGR